MQEKLTIQDIARLAGVSKSTVSRVLNRNASVNPEISARVMQIVEQYGFVPNVTATGLAGGKTRLVGVLVPPLTWPAIPEMLRGIAEYIEDTSYEIILYSIRFERNHSDVLDRILSMRMASGLVAILPGELSHVLIERYQQGLPVVMINDQDRLDGVPWVGVDNGVGAYTATSYLLQQGHQRIAYIQGPQRYYCSSERYRGYTQALQDAGIDLDPALIFQGRFDIPSGRDCARALFQRERHDWPEAVFAANDQMAYGVLEVAEELGVRIPEELAVVGFDDNLLSAHMRPPLTTVRQPFFQMGYTAIELLLTMIDPDHRLTKEHQAQEALSQSSYFDHADVHRPLRVELPAHLVVRASSGAG